MKNITLSMLFLFAMGISLKAQQSISAKLHYPTPGQYDGAIKFKLNGYPNPVEFSLDAASAIFAPNAIMASNDSVANLNFSEMLFLNCLDMVTQDTLSAIIINLSSNWLDSITVYMVSPDSWGSCNGSTSADIVFNPTYIDNNLSVAIDATPDTGVEDTIPSPNNSWSNLCSGDYQFIISSIGNNGNLFTYLYRMKPLNYSGFPNFQLELSTLPSNGQICDGVSLVNVIGGTGPFLYSYDYESYNSDQIETQLCPGVHTLHVIDNSSDTLGINFGIADATNYYQDPFLSGTIDSIYFNTQNCQFDYNTPVDSVFITSFLEIDQTTCIVTVEVWQAGVSAEYTDTISATYSLSGSNLISITYFCGAQKANNLVYQMVTQSSVTGIAGLNSLSSIKTSIEVYPNPTNDRFIIKNMENEAIFFELISVTGMLIDGGTALQGETEVSTSALTEGVYILRLDNNDLRKIIVRKY